MLWEGTRLLETPVRLLEVVCDDRLDEFAGQLKDLLAGVYSLLLGQ